MKVEKEFFILNSNKHISENLMKKFNLAIKRRIKREPVAYIVGRKEFWSKDFLVNKATLIPRPETELLVYKIVDYFKNKSVKILDIGTGSGCILLSILKELKNAKGHGIDISSKAIKVAKINSKKLNNTVLMPQPSLFFIPVFIFKTQLKLTGTTAVLF